MEAFSLRSPSLSNPAKESIFLALNPNPKICLMALVCCLSISPDWEAGIVTIFFSSHFDQDLFDVRLASSVCVECIAQHFDVLQRLDWFSRSVVYDSSRLV